MEEVLLEHRFKRRAVIAAFEICEAARYPTGEKLTPELAHVGMPAAVATALYPATGKRIRDLPITLDKII